MNMTKQNLSFGALLSLALLATPMASLAKTKGQNTNSSSDIVWMDGAAITDLLSVGAFWCMSPRDDSCAFSTLVTEQEGNQFTYLVTGFWDEESIINEFYDAYVTDSGDLCEPAVLDFSRISWTDLDGQSVSKAEIAQFREELADWFGDEEKPDRCFRYSSQVTAEGTVLTQYELDENNNPISPLEFLVDFSTDAADKYPLRWEE